jgi:trk system potassium uptake protein TrkH
VIRLGAVLRIVGLFLMVLAATMAIPLLYALAGPPEGLRPVAAGSATTLAAGFLLFILFPRPETDLTIREGVLVVALIWATVCVFGGLPFYFSPFFASFTDAVFEATSGFTTTGATVLAAVEVLPPALALWRCFTHWLGGMGIVLLGVAILPLLGTGGMHLYRAEFSGARSEKLKPRVTETALALWRIYLALTLAEYVALRWAGMDRLEAACHSFSTLGTGGFSTRTASIAAFSSLAVELVVVVFMILAGINFTLHYRLWRQRQVRSFFGDVEIQTYLLILLAATAAVTASLAGPGGYPWPQAARKALFQVTSILTTTGFVTDDFERWRPLPQLLLLALMFVGGCTGSTAGGLKVARIVLLGRVVRRQFRRIVEPRGVFSVRLGGQVVPEETIQSLLNMVYLALLVFFAASAVLAAQGADVLTSIAAVAASMFNIGPGLGQVGPAEHYGHLPALSKWVLAAAMLCGRLEFYTAIVIFTPVFWRK